MIAKCLFLLKGTNKNSVQRKVLHPQADESQ
ncbi:hypothetical protein T03_6847 [Trichinella britovi]|uniref:Uncharacterized protein n=1 Tax=Trichinella britovi TaxID=45882 RepID=A0A0V0YW88_TRIBR|nr:hypothetical protein T03_6847 [Trichinella britovi]